MDQSCRLCAETTNALTNLPNYKVYSTENGTKVSLADLILKYLTISINSSFSVALICVDCINLIEKWHFFRVKCVERDKHFQKPKLHFEEVITSDAANDTCSVECDEIIVEQKILIPNDTYMSECDGYTEQKDKITSESFVAHNEEASISDRSELSSNERSDAVAKQPVRLNRKSSRRMRTRQSTDEIRKALSCRVRRKINGEECVQEKRTPIGRKREKRAVMHKICAICGMARTDMAAHMRWHSNERPFQCPHCPKIFTNSSNLRSHINIHTREKMYKCDLCDKEFPSTTGRSKHREIHATEHAHLCAICGKSFKYRASLTRHKLIHFEEPKVKCTECGMVFLTKARLTKHFLVHLDVKPFSCSICKRSFNRKDNLKTHMKTHLKMVKTETKIETNDLDSLSCIQSARLPQCNSIIHS